MTSAMTNCADWLNSTPAETKVERFDLSLWSQRNTNPKSELTHCTLATWTSVSGSVEISFFQTIDTAQFADKVPTDVNHILDY